jgi:hypothetical protein
MTWHVIGPAVGRFILGTLKLAAALTLAVFLGQFLFGIAIATLMALAAEPTHHPRGGVQVEAEGRVVPAIPHALPQLSAEDDRLFQRLRARTSGPRPTPASSPP